jgi:four helix bundle protein
MRNEKGEMRKSVAHIKAKAFAVRIVKFSKFLENEKREYILSKQILRSGTSIGANLHECINAQSRADFVSKMQIALKEANETDYWLELFFESEIIDQLMYKSLHDDLNEIIALLISSIKTTKTKDK